MKPYPERTKVISATQWLEIGRSSWNQGADLSIRNRRNSANNRFNNSASSELSVPCLVQLVGFAAANGALSPAQCVELISALAESLKLAL